LIPIVESRPSLAPESPSAVRQYFEMPDIVRRGDGRPPIADVRKEDDRPLPAGVFSHWADEMSGALKGEQDAEVPCGTCTACCTASQFVHIGPDEVDTLAHIPADLLFPAPRSPQGHLLLGYDERGHCPMLINAKCSIYAHRPRACRTYDCRVFSAAGVELAGAQRVKIERRIRRWRFTYADIVDEVRHGAVRAAARYLREHADELPDATAGNTPATLAVLAFEIRDLFLSLDEATGQWSVVLPELDAVRSRLAELHAEK
jgi:Fe-S-cluster containining protein